MRIHQLPSSGAWQVSALITNKHDSWVEIRTYYGIGAKEAEAQFWNSIASMGWENAE